MTTYSIAIREGWPMRAWRRLSIALLLSAAPSGLFPALAQEIGNVDGGTWLDTVTVVGTRTELAIKDNPRSVAVIDEKEIERRPADSIAELLRDVPGVEVADESIAGMKRLRIRGESSRRVTILVDGQEITDHSTYGTPLLIDPAAVERIEVVKGPSSVLYGAKAIGGVVNIVTKKGADKPIQIEAGGTYSSGSRGWQGWTAASGSKDGFDYRFSVSADDHKNRRVAKGIYSATGELDHTTFNNRNLYGHLGYRFGDSDNHYLALKFEQHELESEGRPTALPPNTQKFLIDLPKRDRRKIGLYYDGDDISETVRKIHVDLYYQTIDRLFRNELLASPMPIITVDSTSTSDDRITNYGMNTQVDLDLLENHKTIVGAQYLSDSLTTRKTSRTVTTIRPNPPPPPLIRNSYDKAHIDTFSLYAQDEWSLTDDLTLISGLRLSHIRTELDRTTEAARAGWEGENDTQLLSSLGITWRPFDPLTLRAGYSEGYITPTLLQLFSTSTAGGQTIYGNPALDSETARNFEIGARYEDNGLTFDAGAFYTRAKNYIATAPCTGMGAPVGSCLGAGSSVYVNADRATTFGLELLAEYEFGNSGFAPYVSGAWIRRELDYTTFSTYNSDTPALSGRIGLRYEGDWHDTPVWADVFVRGAVANKQTSLDNGRLVTEKLPGWGTLNLAFGGSYGENDRLSFSLNFNNILNKEYRATFGELPGTGRSIEVTARVKF